MEKMVNNLSFHRSVTWLIVSHQDTVAVKNVLSPCVGNSNLPLTQKGKRKKKNECLKVKLYQNPPILPLYPSLGSKKLIYIKIPMPSAF